MFPRRGQLESRASLKPTAYSLQSTAYALPSRTTDGIVGSLSAGTSWTVRSALMTLIDGTVLGAITTRSAPPATSVVLLEEASPHFFNHRQSLSTRDCDPPRPNRRVH